MGVCFKTFGKLAFAIVLCSLIVFAVGEADDSPNELKPHPLDPLNRTEIYEISALIRESKPCVKWVFVWVSLAEPEKSLLLPYFLNDTEPPPHSIPRKGLAVLIHPESGTTYEALVNLDKRTLEKWEQLPVGVDSSFATDEMSSVADMVLDDEKVLKRLEIYGEFYGNKSNIVTDVWKYGYSGDKEDYKGRRMAQVFFYGKNFENDNFYAHPMGFVAVVDILSQKVVDIEEIPIHSDFHPTNREGDEVPPAEGNYDPKVSKINYRDDVSPIHVSQPNGSSIDIQGNVLRWQKFKMRIGTNGREGLVIYNINYNDSDTIRPLIYRASISELFVPYGDPRPPYHRKMALDVGEYGLGFSASELRAPDACRGTVHFLDAVNNNKRGAPLVIPNAFCVYEEDAGILWRKMDPVTRRVVTARSQRLVLTFIATVSNYDYQIKWMFYQDATIRLEMVLTGILNQNLLGKGDNAHPGGHGTIVVPQVSAQFHQHFFTVRLDTEIDGNKNTVSVMDVKPDEADAGSETHPYGNGFHVEETVLKTSGQARTKTNPDTARTWKVIGAPSNKHPYTGKPKAWKLVADGAARLMMKKDSLLHPRCAFTDYDVWVTPYQEGQLYAGGFYINGSGLPEWVKNDPEADIEDEDIVLWHVFGITHVTRVEDLPVMPSEKIGMTFKPFNFFTESPAIDVMPIVREPKKLFKLRSNVYMGGKGL